MFSGVSDSAVKFLAAIDSLVFWAPNVAVEVDIRKAFLKILLVFIQQQHKTRKTYLIFAFPLLHNYMILQEQAKSVIGLLNNLVIM